MGLLGLVEPIQRVSAQSVRKIIRVPIESRWSDKVKDLVLRVSDIFKPVISDKKFPKKCAS